MRYFIYSLVILCIMAFTQVCDAGHRGKRGRVKGVVAKVALGGPRLVARVVRNRPIRSFVQNRQPVRRVVFAPFRFVFRR